MTTTNPGEPLKSSRERQGLSINDVSVATKINPRILKALEEGNHSGLPPKSFARGFIRSYAAYLKIDAQPIIDAYNMAEQAAAAVVPEPSASNANNEATEAATKATAKLASAKPAKPSDESKTRLPGASTSSSVTSKALLVTGLVVLMILIVGVKKIVDKYAQERVVEPTPVVTPAPTDAAATPPPADAAGADAAPDATTEKPADGAADTATAVGSTDAKTEDSKTENKDDKKEAAKPEEAKVAAPTATPTTAVQPPVVPPAKVETPVPPTKIEAKPEVKAETKPEPPKPDAKPAAKPAQPQEVIIEALDAVEVRIKIDGEDIKTVKLTPESVHTVKAKGNVELEVSDGGMVNIIHNGRERGVPGDLGKPAKLKYP